MCASMRPKARYLLALCGNPLMTSGFPTQRASNAGSFSMSSWWQRLCGNEERKDSKRCGGRDLSSIWKCDLLTLSRTLICGRTAYLYSLLYKPKGSISRRTAHFYIIPYKPTGAINRHTAHFYIIPYTPTWAISGRTVLFYMLLTST